MENWHNLHPEVVNNVVNHRVHHQAVLQNVVLQNLDQSVVLLVHLRVVLSLGMNVVSMDERRRNG